MEVINITSFFPTTHSFTTSGHFKEARVSKKDILKKFLAGKQFDDLIFIGDSPKDVELVSVAGGKAYLYAHPGRTFREVQLENHSINRINDLREVLKEL